MFVITIRSDVQDSGPDDIVDSRKVFIASQRARHTITKTVPTITPSILEEFRWYLEDYAELDPFNSERASKAFAALAQYGQNFLSSLDLGSIIPPSQLDGPVVVHVEEHAQHGLFADSPVFWELLERLELWRPSYRPNSVTVLRKVVGVDVALLDQRSFPREEENDNPIRVLVMTARSGDSNDVAPRLVSRLIVEASDQYEGRLEVEIVRPGSFEALKVHLESKPQGYFDLVHFDVHGVQDPDTGTVSLKFLKHEPGCNYVKVRSDYRSSSEVGSMLHQLGVRQVVLNACRSAYGSRSETNIAKSFVNAGIPVVLAMSFTIADRSVEIFTEAFYRGFAEHKLPLEAAACLARSAMQSHPDRVSKMGSVVQVADSIVPVVYMDSTLPSNPLGKLPKITIEEPQDLRRLYPHGREMDIMHLESALLLGKKPVFLTGLAGSGKTALLCHVRDWWATTGLIERALHIMLAPDLDINDLYLRLQRHFTNDKSPMSRAAVLEYLSDHRCLITLDRFEEVNMVGKYSAFLKFLKSLSKTKALIIISSRRAEKWLGSATIPHPLPRLRTIPGIQLIRGLCTGARRVMNFPDYNSDADLQYLEQIINLVNGNPLVLRLLFQAGLCMLKSPQEFYLDMLNGAPVMLNREEARQREALRSLLQLEEIVNQCMPERLGDGFTPTIFACFQQILPVGDLAKFAQFWTLESSRHMGDTPQERARATIQLLESMGVDLEDVDEGMKLMVQMMKVVAKSTPEEIPKPKLSLATIVSSLDDVDFPDLPLVTEHLALGCTNFVSLLEGNGFLEAERPSEGHAIVTAKLHPLVPFILRAHPGYEQNFFNIAQSCKHAFVLYYCYRTKQWPWAKPYYNQGWTQPREQLDLEFANFMTATWIGLGSDNEDSIQLACLFRLTTVVQRGALKEPARLRAVVILMERALARMLEEIAKLKVQANEKPQTIMGALQSTVSKLESTIDGWAGWASSASPQLRTEGQQHAELALFAMRGMALNVASHLALYHHRIKSAKRFDYIEHSKLLVKEAKGHFPAQFTPEIKERMLKALEFSEFGINRFLDGDKLSQGELFRARQEYAEWLRSTDEDSEEAPTKWSSWQDLPIEILSLSAPFRHAIEAHRKIRKAIREKKWKEAERLVDEAFVVEINDASNDATNKADLIEFRSEIAKGQGQWDNALKHLKEMWKLQDSVNVGVLTEKEQSERDAMLRRLEKRI